MTDIVEQPLPFDAVLTLLRMINDPAAMESKLRSLSEASAAARRVIDQAAKDRAELEARRTAHEAELAELTKRAADEHERQRERIKRAAAKVEAAAAEFEKEKARVTERERYVEARAADLSARLGHRGLDAA